MPSDSLHGGIYGDPKRRSLSDMHKIRNILQLRRGLFLVTSFALYLPIAGKGLYSAIELAESTEFEPDPRCLYLLQDKNFVTDFINQNLDNLPGFF